MQEIKGISPKIAQALYDRGIDRYDQLCDLTPDTLSGLLQAEMSYFTPGYVRRWKVLEQARDLARQANPRHPPAQGQSDAKHRPGAAQTGAAQAGAAQEEPQASPRKHEWDTHASFSVFFERQTGERGQQKWQTRLYFNESKGISEERAEFTGIETALWVNWILERARLPEAAKRPTEPQVSAPPAIAPAYDAQSARCGIEIAGVEVSEVPAPASGREKRLAAQVRFRLSGPQAGELAETRIPFRIEVYTVDAQSGACMRVACGEGQLHPQIPEYLQRQTFPVPGLGCYELHTLVLILPPADIMACHQGPTIRVVL